MVEWILSLEETKTRTRQIAEAQSRTGFKSCWLDRLEKSIIFSAGSLGWLAKAGPRTGSINRDVQGDVLKSACYWTD